MRFLLSLALMTLAFSFSVFGQEMMHKAKATDEDKSAAIPTNGVLKRGAPIGSAILVPLEKILNDPIAFAGKTVLIEGVVVRSCKMEGCWAELAQRKDGKSVRVKMKDHSFFIPLQAAGSFARAEGVITVKTLTKEHVEHMVKDDGAKFENRNADGTVDEISFEAIGIELKKVK
ncbi:MAG: DUF4920 domain-containing protein [Pyrinomonadaceae bacterium]